MCFFSCFPIVTVKLGTLLVGNSHNKPDKYTISRTSIGSWKKKCKLLGSLLDLDEDIKRRKGLAIDSFKTLEKSLKVLSKE